MLPVPGEKAFEREMNNKVEWGVFGVSDLAVKKVIPAMQRGEWSQVAAIASRDLKTRFLFCSPCN